MSLVNNCAPSSLSLSFCKYFSRLLLLSLYLYFYICWKRGCLTVFLVAAFVYNYCIISLCVEIAARCCLSKFSWYFDNAISIKCVLIIIYLLRYDVRYCLRTAAFWVLLLFSHAFIPFCTLNPLPHSRFSSRASHASFVSFRFVYTCQLRYITICICIRFI